MGLEELQEEAAKCQLCSLAKDRITPVFAKGNPFAKIMICGMCPGPDENDPINKMGWPFIGKSGKHLDEIFEDTQLTQKDVYITNMVKCYLKPGTRLKDDWIISCMSYLTGQISSIEPKIILALGSDAGRALPETRNLQHPDIVPSVALLLPWRGDSIQRQALTASRRQHRCRDVPTGPRGFHPGNFRSPAPRRGGEMPVSVAILVSLDPTRAGPILDE